MSEIRKLETQVLSSDGKHQLKGVVYLPEGEKKGLFHVVHGMTEYIGRYDGFMRKAAERGYVCFGYDHLGHGNTALEGELGFIAHKDGWEYLVKDVAVFERAMKKEYGEDLPLFLLGHSMGSFIVRLSVTVNADPVPEKLIVMGTGGPNPVGGLGVGIAKTIRAFRGEKHVSPFLENLAFGAYNKPFASENDPKSWLTKDKSIREAYVKDPFCNYHFTISGMIDLLQLNNRSNAKTWFSSVPETLPVLLVSGEKDPVGSFSKGVNEVEAKLKECGKNVKKILYPDCRHEILNDTCREQTAEDIFSFIEDCIP